MAGGHPPLAMFAPTSASEKRASTSSKDTHTQGASPPSGGEVGVTFEATLTITLGSLAFQEGAGSFCPSPHNEASSGV